MADRFHLRQDIQFHTRVESAVYNAADETWTVSTDAGDRVTARFCIMATGCLSARNTPDFPGLENFRGERFHTGNWPRDGVNFAGKRVGVVGTGSTGIQAIPVIAEQAAHLFVFQRTAQYSVPARNAPIDAEEEARIKADYKGYRERNTR